ncbi:uncharacterized protein LOC117670493 [Pantherophis guttatus]|uniref:Uncharacterized protein LOC117670493 n=1 Tax=Pantherophis guttatus TaxID=94885 RepID=A0ABM3YNA6_PANGU|nr:uncharacterized protein LOC117670493 [Pantherophis guttatus]
MAAPFQNPQDSYADVLEVEVQDTQTDPVSWKYVIYENPDRPGNEATARPYQRENPWTVPDWQTAEEPYRIAKEEAAAQPVTLKGFLSTILLGEILSRAADKKATARELEKKTASAPSAQEALSVAAKAETAPEAQATARELEKKTASAPGAQEAAPETQEDASDTRDHDSSLDENYAETEWTENLSVEDTTQILTDMFSNLNDFSSSLPWKSSQATARELEKKTASAPGAQEALSVAAKAETTPEAQVATASDTRDHDLSLDENYAETEWTENLSVEDTMQILTDMFTNQNDFSSSLPWKSSQEDASDTWDHDLSLDENYAETEWTENLSVEEEMLHRTNISRREKIGVAVTTSRRKELLKTALIRVAAVLGVGLVAVTARTFVSSFATAMKLEKKTASAPGAQEAAPEKQALAMKFINSIASALSNEAMKFFKEFVSAVGKPLLVAGRPESQGKINATAMKLVSKIASAVSDEKPFQVAGKPESQDKINELARKFFHETASAICDEAMKFFSEFPSAISDEKPFPVAGMPESQGNIKATALKFGSETASAIWDEARELASEFPSALSDEDPFTVPRRPEFQAKMNALVMKFGSEIASDVSHEAMKFFSEIASAVSDEEPFLVAGRPESQGKMNATARELVSKIASALSDEEPFPVAGRSESQGKINVATARELVSKIASALSDEEPFPVAGRSESQGKINGAGAGGDAAAGDRKKSRTILSIPQLLRKLSYEQKMLLRQRTTPVIQNMGFRNMTEFKNKVKENSNLKMRFVEMLEDYVANDLQGVVKECRVTYIGHCMFSESSLS